MALANKDTLTSVSTSAGENKIRCCQNADVFLSEGLKVSGPEVETPCLVAPLISMDPHTDTIMDRFKMDDAVLLRLHQLVGSVHSSHWEALLHSPKWNLMYEEASNLTTALLADLQSMAVITKVLPSY